MTGKRIVNTRATHQNSRFTALLQSQGAEVIEYPCIAIVPPEDDRPLREALANLAHFDWLLLTSTNTVLALAASYPLAPARLGNAAVGPATARAAQAYLGLETVLLPETFTAETLGEALPIHSGERVLIPASAIARTTLADILRARGAEVTVIEAYRTVPGTGGANVPALLAQKQVDAVTFTSASTVENFMARLSAEGGNHADLASVCIACIGPQTAAMAKAHGLQVNVMPTTHTLDGLMEALAKYFL
ncbi:uroporphyrinogen-III synthase [Armatimonas sp.]|uniref:uroporphyrinogen-III synthase n=1 Tax=Armatimonas sp. TaxID=1872638 RepID=UPI00375044CB